jgi:hypothetical protein
MRKVWLVLFVVVLGLFGVLGPPWYQRSSPINRQAFERIEDDMTLTQVEAILGRPAGNHSTIPVEHSIDPGITICDNGAIHVWWGNEGDVVILVGPEGQVLDKSFLPVIAKDYGIVERFRWRFERWMLRLTQAGR